tara:strand:+ start:11620 stop:12225 length:606 start_codon:yes stop_codon:yes gene_type:complete
MADKNTSLAELGKRGVPVATESVPGRPEVTSTPPKKEEDYDTKMDRLRHAASGWPSVSENAWETYDAIKRMMDSVGMWQSPLAGGDTADTADTGLEEIPEEVEDTGLFDTGDTGLFDTGDAEDPAPLDVNGNPISAEDWRAFQDNQAEWAQYRKDRQDYNEYMLRPMTPKMRAQYAQLAPSPPLYKMDPRIVPITKYEGEE